MAAVVAKYHHLSFEANYACRRKPPSLPYLVASASVALLLVLGLSLLYYSFVVADEGGASSRRLISTGSVDESNDDQNGALSFIVGLLVVVVAIVGAGSVTKDQYKKTGRGGSVLPSKTKNELDFDTVVAKGSGTWNKHTNTPSESYKGNAGNVWSNEILAEAKVINDSSVLIPPDQIKAKSTYASNVLSKIKEQIPRFKVFHRRTDNHSQYNQVNDSGVLQCIAHELKNRVKALRKEEGDLNILLDANDATSSPDVSTTVCVGPGTGKRTPHFPADGAKTAVLTEARSLAAELFVNGDPPDGFSTAEMSAATDKLESYIDRRELQVRNRPRGSNLFHRYTPEGRRDWCRTQILSNVNSIRTSTYERKLPTGDPARRVASYEARLKLRRNGGLCTRRGANATVRTSFISDKPCCKGDACKGDGFITFRPDGVLHKYTDPYCNTDYYCRRCYDFVECGHGVKFYLCKDPFCNSMRCTKHGKWVNACAECHPFLHICNRRRVRRRQLMNGRIADGEITEQDALSYLHTDENKSRLEAELGCSLEEWPGHLVGKFNAMYKTDYASYADINKHHDVHIDEIVGCCNWRMDQLGYCFHHLNSQLLLAGDNLRKAKYAFEDEIQAKIAEIDNFRRDD